MAQSNTVPLVFPSDVILQFEQIQPHVQKHINLLFVEMKKVHYQLLKRRRAALQFQNHLENNTFPSNLQQKLSSQNWPTSIATSTINDANQAEQLLWINFKKTILAQRSAIFQQDLQTLDERFLQYTNTQYIGLRFKTLCPEFSKHPNVLNGMVLTFSVLHQEFLHRPLPTPKRQSGTTTPTSIHSEAQYWDDDMAIDDEDRAQSSSPTASSSSTSKATSSSSSSSSSSSNSAVQSKKDQSLQDQINTLTSLVHSFIKNATGTPSPRERRAPSPKTPTRQPRPPTSTPPLSTLANVRNNMFNTEQTTPTRQNKSTVRAPSAPTTPTFTFPSFNGLAPTMQHPFPTAPFHNPFSTLPPQHPYYGPTPIGNHLYGYPPSTFHPTYQQPTVPPHLPTFPFGVSPDSARRTAQGNHGRTQRAPSVRFAKPKTQTNQL